MQAVLGFVKVMVSSIQAKDLHILLSDIVNGVLLWSSVSRHHFRSKVCDVSLIGHGSNNVYMKHDRILSCSKYTMLMSSRAGACHPFCFVISLKAPVPFFLLRLDVYILLKDTICPLLTKSMFLCHLKGHSHHGDLDEKVWSCRS